VRLRFARSAEHNVTGFTLDAGRTKGMIFTRRARAQSMAQFARAGQSCRRDF
jgi:hypothetical protein